MCKICVGDRRKTELMVDVCNSLALGYLQPWVPPPVKKDPITPTATGALPAPVAEEASAPVAKRGAKPVAAAPPKNPGARSSIFIPSEAMSDLKKALEVQKLISGVYESVHLLGLFVSAGL